MRWSTKQALIINRLESRWRIDTGEALPDHTAAMAMPGNLEAKNSSECR